MKIVNVLAQAMNPSRFVVMAKKVFKRFSERVSQSDIEANYRWLNESKTSFRDVAIKLDAELWAESEQAASQIKSKADQVLSSIDYDLGGGGAYPFLYFLTRFMRPDCIVETGVAAGFSSSSFLAALEVNKTGALYSSDFPYFRIPQPEKFIGVVVPDELRSRWKLYIEGDEINLPLIAETAGKVDVFHYDSDKSYSGRQFAMAWVRGLLSERGVILMDDIQDNSYFRDYIRDHKPASWRVYEFEGKFVGQIGELSRR